MTCHVACNPVSCYVVHDDYAFVSLPWDKTAETVPSCPEGAGRERDSKVYAGSHNISIISFAVRFIDRQKTRRPRIDGQESDYPTGGSAALRTICQPSRDLCNAMISNIPTQSCTISLYLPIGATGISSRPALA